MLISVAGLSGNAIATQPETKQIQYTLTVEQLDQVEESWTKAILSHAEKLTINFTRYLPDNYQDYATFRASEWQPAFERDWDNMVATLCKIVQKP